MEVLILIKYGENPKAEKQAYKSLHLKYTVFINSATNHMIQTQVCSILQNETHSK